MYITKTTTLPESTTEDTTKPDLQELLEKIINDIFSSRYIPHSTYRLQFNPLFTFKDATRIIPYLKELGITDIYASPYLRARTGSMHGYDICDHNSLNPELGSEADYQGMVDTLKANGMNHILDIVPNHMGIGEVTNQWWMDVLENGASSIYNDFFDIDWKPVKEELKDKVLLPVLGDQYGTVLERGELKLQFVADEGAFYLDYYELRLPINPRTYSSILEQSLMYLEQQLADNDESLLEYKSIITNLGYIPPRWVSDPSKTLERNREKEIIKKRLMVLYASSGEARVAIDSSVREINGVPLVAQSFDKLDNLIENQAYRLAYWRVAGEEINYRRFFDINELAAIRVENPKVLEKSHQLIFKLLSEGAVKGLRVDHADGLRDPAGYLWRLQKGYILNLSHYELAREIGRELTPEESKMLEDYCDKFQEKFQETATGSSQANPFFVVVEKIVGRGEGLPFNWPVDGMTGYEFAKLTNGIFIEAANEKKLDELYLHFIEDKIKYSDLVYQSKRNMLRVAMASEINLLAHMLNRISEHDRHTRDFTLNNLRLVLNEVISLFPVYRTYIVPDKGIVEGRDRAYIETAIARAKKRNSSLDLSAFDFLRNILFLNYASEKGAETQAMQAEFVAKFQQLTSPIMAKGLEDTAFYRYNRLISLNEVGGEPDQFGNSVETFHRLNNERLTRWPNSMLTTSTHDTKRSEDVRARINLISEFTEEWGEALKRWARINRRRRRRIDGQLVPVRNEEYLLYQVLLGVWPFGEPDSYEYSQLVLRIEDYMIKALREAKVNSSWINQNNAYETAMRDFIRNVLNNNGTNPFLDDFRQFQSKVALYGALNSLAQLLLKLTSPGLPDIYQGNELWDFSLVDPDNRRPVDFALRASLLATLPSSPNVDLAQDLLAHYEDGRIKLFITRQILQYRRANPELFQKGDYKPRFVEGNRNVHICAFSRSREDKVVLTVVPRLTSQISQGDVEWPLGEKYWAENWLSLPDELEDTIYENLLTGEFIKVSEYNGQTGFSMSKILEHLPLAFLIKRG